MDIFGMIGVLFIISAIFSILNYHYLKFPRTIGLMFIAMVASLLFIILGKIGISTIDDTLRIFLQGIDFYKILMEGMLGALLFAGALHVDLYGILKQKWTILIFASAGLMISTFIVGTLFYYLVNYLGIQISYLYCLLFGALISPTDPVAVLGILKKNKVSSSLKIKITGESLFNDGFAVVIFLTILGLLTTEAHFSILHIGELFFVEVIGGIIFGYLVGLLAYKLLKRIDNYQVEVLLTLALVFGGFYFAGVLHLSAPLMIVVAGLFIGNHGRKYAMTESTRDHLDNFWELIDEILNAVLFVLIGLELVLVKFSFASFILGIGAIMIVILARLISIGVPVNFIRFRRSFSKGAVTILTWGGLRGGISIALALSLPLGPERDLILTATYMVVAFSILIQGTTLKYLIKKIAS